MLAAVAVEVAVESEVVVDALALNAVVSGTDSNASTLVLAVEAVVKAAVEIVAVLVAAVVALARVEAVVDTFAVVKLPSGVPIVVATWACACTVKAAVAAAATPAKRTNFLFIINKNPYYSTAEAAKSFESRLLPTPELVRESAHKRDTPEPRNRVAFLNTLKNQIRMRKNAYTFALIYFVSKISEFNVNICIKISLAVPTSSVKNYDFLTDIVEI